ncbi:FAD-dependent oxidoreductase [Roseomonas sp. CECT 9278]|uniref:FAD-dependent oxidoreductase n=1 Tax=Roseomonas sp. CECT 9278 TaxID=2845823 RepID=UPI001E5D07A5|nr:FAD-dependent oxidoreductase [Roseomonas sp. CECT 9278]CAH0201307.1 3-oxosteroid 1-dehydrogenase [Roseomonas sp. CECT 9278]
MKAGFDVVVIGGGCAGLATAIAASDLGLDCVVLEKAPKLGGGSAISSGYLWIGANHLDAAAGGTDTPEAVTDYIRYVGAGAVDEARMAAFVAEAPGALRFFEAAGIPFRLSPRIDHYGMAPGARGAGRIVDTPPFDAGAFGDAVLLPAGPLFRVSGSTLPGGANSPALWAAAEAAARDQPGLRGGGAGLVSRLVQLAIGRGIPLLTGVAVERLTVTDGRVSGVVATGGIIIEARRAVVIASGGYESSPELVDRFEALPGWQSMFPGSVTGDGLVMATEHGAATQVIGNNLSVFLGFRNPDEAPSGVAPCRLSGTQELPSPHTMVVNRHGRRFADESFFQAMAPALHHFDVVARERPNLPCWLIFDRQFADSFSFGGRPPGAAIPSWVQRADSIEALARALGIDADGLAATVRGFNADARDGVDRAFGRGQSAWGLNRYDPRTTLGAIDAPPFYGIRLHPTALSSVGLLADAKARVRHVRGHPMAGLYAVGNAAARTETGSGYQTGFSLASGLTFGLIAARDTASDREAN